MPDAVSPAPDRPAREWVELRSSGLLWLVNRVVFHPRGFAMAVVTDEHGDVAGWRLDGDGRAPWRFPDDVDERELLARVERFLDGLRPDAQAALMADLLRG